MTGMGKRPGSLYPGPAVREGSASRIEGSGFREGRKHPHRPPGRPACLLLAAILSVLSPQEELGVAAVTEPSGSWGSELSPVWGLPRPHGWPQLPSAKPECWLSEAPRDCSPRLTPPLAPLPHSHWGCAGAPKPRGGLLDLSVSWDGVVYKRGAFTQPQQEAARPGVLGGLHMGRAGTLGHILC